MYLFISLFIYLHIYIYIYSLGIFGALQASRGTVLEWHHVWQFTSHISQEAARFQELAQLQSSAPQAGMPRDHFAIFCQACHITFAFHGLTTFHQLVRLVGIRLLPGLAELKQMRDFVLYILYIHESDVSLSLC